jgi:hypothetical protein
MSKLHWYSSGSGRIEFQMTIAQAKSASHQGQCDEDVRALSKVPAVAVQLAEIKPEVLRDELDEYGSWDAEELADHNQNIQRILWLAAGNILDEHPLGDFTERRLEICEAYYTLEVDYNVSGWLHERPSNRRRNMSTDVQLHRMGFEIGRHHYGFQSLSDTGKDIYMKLVERYRLPAPEGPEFDAYREETRQ